MISTRACLDTSAPSPPDSSRSRVRCPALPGAAGLSPSGCCGRGTGDAQPKFSFGCRTLDMPAWAIKTDVAGSNAVARPRAGVRRHCPAFGRLARVWLTAGNRRTAPPSAADHVCPSLLQDHRGGDPRCWRHSWRRGLCEERQCRLARRAAICCPRFREDDAERARKTAVILLDCRDGCRTPRAMALAGPIPVDDRAGAQAAVRRQVGGLFSRARRIH